MVLNYTDNWVIYAMKIIHMRFCIIHKVHPCMNPTVCKQQNSKAVHGAREQDTFAWIHAIVSL